MTEYFIVANSFAAPFVSDRSTGFVEADTPETALDKYADSYGHPAGLYSANCYESANAYHKGEPLLAQWISNKERALRENKPDKGEYSAYSSNPAHISIDGREVEVDNPKEGSVTNGS